VGQFQLPKTSATGLRPRSCESRTAFSPLGSHSSKSGARSPAFGARGPSCRCQSRLSRKPRT
jgi:hypothetical protein